MSLILHWGGEGGERCTLGTTERRENLGSSFLNADSNQQPTNSREITLTVCLSLRLTLDAVLLHVLYLSRRRATASLPRTRLSGWEDRLPLTCSLRSPELSEVELHSSRAR